MGGKIKEGNAYSFGRLFREMVLPLFVYMLASTICSAIWDQVLLQMGYGADREGVSQGLSAFLDAISMIIGAGAMYMVARPIFPKQTVATPHEHLQDAADKQLSYRFTWQHAIRILLALLLGPSMAIAFNMLILYSGICRLSPAYSNAVTHLYAVDIFWGVILYGLIAPVIEEVLFRGIIYRRIRRFSGDILAATLVSSLLFALYHGNLVQGVYAFAIGLIFALIYEWTGIIFIPVLLHATANLCIYLLNTLAPSQVYAMIFSPAGCVVSLLLTAGCVYAFSQMHHQHF